MSQYGARKRKFVACEQQHLRSLISDIVIRLLESMTCKLEAKFQHSR